MKKSSRVKLAIALVVLVALVVLCVKRWDVWFGNPPEASFEVEEKIDRVLLTMGDETNSRYVTWVSGGSEGSCWLDYYAVGSSDTLTIEAEPQVYHSRSGKTCFYSASLENLKNGADYSYRVRAISDSTDWYSFHYQDSIDFSFLFFGDVQEDEDAGFDTLLPAAVRQNKDVQFLLFGGDLIERPTDHYWRITHRMLDSVKKNYPILSVAGNHEYLKGVERTLEERFPLTFKYFQKNMKAHGENALYTFAQGDVRFYFLDSNRDFWNFFQQRTWLKEQLEQSKQKWNVVVLHHPLHSVRGRFRNLMQRLFFDGVIEDYGVDLVLQGHEHVYARFDVETEEGQMVGPLRLVSYASQKVYNMTFVGDVCKWGTGERFYQRITLSADTLNLKTYVMGKELYDNVSIVKNSEGCKFIDEGQQIPQRIYVPEWFQKNKRAKRVKEFSDNIEEWKAEHPDALIREE